MVKSENKEKDRMSGIRVEDMKFYAESNSDERCD